MNKIIACSLAVCLLGSGCATMDDQDRTRAEGAGAGAVGGAVLGGLLAWAIGEDVATGAAIGAGVGAVGGLAYGDYVAGKKAEFAKEENYLDASLASAQQVTGQVAAYNASLETEIGGLEKALVQNEAALQAGTADKAQIAALKQRCADNLAQCEKAMKNADAEIALQREVISEQQNNPDKARLASLQGQLQKLESERAGLEQRNQRIAALGNRISV